MAAVNPHLWVVVAAVFLASAVEFVEAFTIVLAIGVSISWRNSLAGAGIAVGLLVLIVVLLGSALVRFLPIDTLRVLVGVLLVLFGLKWTKRAVLRYGGLEPPHNEGVIYERWLAGLKERREPAGKRIDASGVGTSFKSVLCKGLEVAFIVVMFGAPAGTLSGGGGIGPASIGAATAVVVVIVAGAAVRAPLRRLPENTLKLIIGVMLTTFGTFWGGEGLGIRWWGGDLFLIALALFYLLLAVLMVLWIRSQMELTQTGKHSEPPGGSGDETVKRAFRAFKGIYGFFVGDVILLVGVGIAFAAAAVLSQRLHEEKLLIVVTFVGLIIIGLITTIGRELGRAIPPPAPPRREKPK